MRREKVAFAILVFILIFLFAFTFAVLGKGEYNPSETNAPTPTSMLAGVTRGSDL